MRALYTVFALGGLLLAGCLPEGDEKGIPVEASDRGPKIVFEPLLKPVADIPFPNDLILHKGEEGVRWNISLDRASEHLRRIREMINEQDGFGPYAPAFLSFDAPLDLSTVTDESVYLVNIEPGHPREGELAHLDLGRGHFPALATDGGWFGQDPAATQPDVLYTEANTRDLDGDGVPERVLHFDYASNTLIIRPVIPLAQGARHAVILTRAVKGEDGETIRSPFDVKSHALQAELIGRALEITGVSRKELAFGWTYKTTEVVAPVMKLREGLYGEGIFARMKDLAEPKISDVHDTSITHDADGEKFPEDPHDSLFTLQAEFLGEFLGLIAGVRDDSNFALDFPHVDYFVFGKVPSPDLRRSEHRDFAIDWHTGEGPMERDEIPFFASIPKATAQHKPPFPVMLYFHGTGTSRMEVAAIANEMARQGMATFSFDEVGHGPLFHVPTLIQDNPDQAALIRSLPVLIANIMVPERVNEFIGLELDEALEKLEEVGLFRELGVLGRNEDLNEDGRFEVAESFFFADPFRMCSSFWQDLIDFMQMVRMLRGLSQSAVPSEAHPNPATATFDELKPYLLNGDFNADGILDLGGPDVTLGVAGTSLGGFHATMAAAIEPEVTTATPIVAGGGLSDIMVRSDLRGITERIFIEILGTVIVGCPTEEGVMLTQGNDADRCRKPDRGAFATVDALEPGATVMLENLDNGEVKGALVNEEGGFSLAVESDKGDRLKLSIDGAGDFEIESRFEGSGEERNTPEFRRAVHIQQNVFDRCDPINFARHLFWEPLPGHPPTNVLFYQALGDETVPVSTGVLSAVAAGVFGRSRAEWEVPVKALIDKGVLANGTYDVDDVRGDNPRDMPALGALRPVKTETGVSSIRFADVNGKHEWIAGYNKDGFEAGRHSQRVISIFQSCEGRVIFDGEPECLQAAECELMDEVQDIPGCQP